MGFAHGQLMKERLLKFFPEVYAYMETQVSSKNGTFTKLVEKFGLETALDLSYDATKVWSLPFKERDLMFPFTRPTSNHMLTRKFRGCQMPLVCP